MGELEHTLLAHQSVHNALIFVPDTGPLKGKLVGVLSLRNPTVPSAPKTKVVELLEGLDNTNAQKELLDVRQHMANTVSMDQDCLAFGGDSITAMQVTSQCRLRGIRLVVKDILRSLSLRQIAEHAEAARKSIASLKGDQVTTSRPLGLIPDFPISHVDILTSKLKIEVEAIEDAYPCSPMQEGILISQAQAPETHKFYAVLAVNWLGHVSFQTVLKTYTPRVDIVPNLASLFQYPHQHRLDYNELIPPHRLAIFEDRDADYFNLEINHALLDGGSMSVMVRDLVLAYDQELPPGPKYKDYISVLQSLSKEHVLSYWKDHPLGVQTLLFPALQDETFLNKELRVIHVPIAENTKSELQKFTRFNKMTLANVFQVVWGLVLRAYSGEPDVVFGYLSSGRDIEGVDIENSVGAFITMLEDFLDSLPHQHTSLAEVQHTLQLPGERLFNTILTLQRPMVGDTVNNNIFMEYLGGSDPTEYDLGVDVTITEAKIDVSISYWTTFMSERQASMLSSTFAAFSRTLRENFGEIDLLGEEQYPSMFISMAQVPLTANGKADRRQLRELAASLPREDALLFSLADTIKQDPTTEMEFQIRKLWAAVLNMEVDEIGAGDHFFPLGGGSIIAMTLTTLARLENLHLSVQNIFQTPVLAEMAAQVETQSLQCREQQLPMYQPFSLVREFSNPDFVSEIATHI
ncbi:hypothetical protein PRK78_002146 [Emydomyces testavorans]|uniref:Carrier domain-containing protein n=1 Tax=Emydomyces testavorans TaxID=2070801 RepID=A0AAF0IHC1_9EURO|nr:hypothetical protein PRK78_002146 [Emydomyces testavorans]